MAFGRNVFLAEASGTDFCLTVATTLSKTEIEKLRDMKHYSSLWNQKDIDTITYAAMSMTPSSQFDSPFLAKACMKRSLTIYCLVMRSLAIRRVW